MLTATRPATESDRVRRTPDRPPSALRETQRRSCRPATWQGITSHDLHHHQGRHRDFLQGLGPERRAADRVPPRLAAERRRLGQPDDVLPRRGLSRDRPRPARSRPFEPDRATATTWTPTRPTSPSWSRRSTFSDAIHIGHSTGGGEVAHYVARAEPGRVAKAVLIDAVPPVMVKKESNPGGTPIEVFDGYPRRARRQPRAALPRYPERALLRLQPAGREGVGRPDPTIGGGRA